MSTVIDVATACGLAYAVFLLGAALVLWISEHPKPTRRLKSVSADTEMALLATNQAAPCCTA